MSKSKKRGFWETQGELRAYRQKLVALKQDPRSSSASESRTSKVTETP